jgi:lysophospholipase L1-like esterase
MNWETLMCLGDSITIGSRSYCGYPEYAGYYLEKALGNKWNVINHSVSGYTAMDLARSLSADMPALKSHAPGIITILAGTNDVKKDTPPDLFRISYGQCILKSRLIAQEKNVVLVTIPRFTPKVTYPYAYAMNEKVDRFNAIISELAASEGLRTFTFSFSETDFTDGVHLSEAGALTAGQQLSAYVLADKGIGLVVEQRIPEFIPRNG